MDVYCVKDRRVTPNVKGTERVVWTKNKRKLLKVKCAVCGITKTQFLPLKWRAAAKECEIIFKCVKNNLTYTPATRKWFARFSILTCEITFLKHVQQGIKADAFFFLFYFQKMAAMLAELWQLGTETRREMILGIRNHKKLKTQKIFWSKVLSLWFKKMRCGEIDGRKPAYAVSH